MNKVREIQLGELSLLKSFIAICSKHDLRYYALGGTLLGAIRHKGFIPWDDDLDFFMPRKDYEKLAQLWPQKADSRYQLSKSNEIDLLQANQHVFKKQEMSKITNQRQM